MKRVVVLLELVLKEKMLVSKLKDKKTGKLKKYEVY